MQPIQIQKMIKRQGLIRLFSRTALYTFLVFTLTIGISGSAWGRAQPEADLEVVWILFGSQAELADLASRVDIWEVQHDRGAVVALISTEEAKWLTSAGYTYIAHPASIQHPATIPEYSCYRTIDEQYALLDSWAQVYPQLAQTTSIGLSYEGREMRVLQLTNALTSGAKPAFFLMANIHGRELITNEAALDFAEHLLVNYNIDPGITWLLDQQVIYILVSANPDGHVKNEPGEPWAWWRKNTHPDGNCSALSYGVDLDRNAAFMWGNDSINPCTETYQGPAPASEPETAVIATFIRSLFPDQRGADLNDPAPVDKSGIFITLHSYGNLILWPWAHTYAESPNAEQFAMLGSKLANYNGYEAKAASGLYPASGTTLDFAYGELGAASFLFEMGSNADGFYPSCARYDAIIKPNIQAFLYAAKVARSPYTTAFGPDSLDLTLTPSLTSVGASVVVSATIDDTLSGNDAIAATELTIDNPPWNGGVPIVLTVTDTIFDTSIEDVIVSLDTTQLTPGRHIIFLRGQDNAGYWGPVSAAFLDVLTPTFELEPRFSRGYGRPGHTLTYTLTLTNTSPVTQTYWMTGSLSTWKTQFTPPPLSLLSMHQSALTLTVSTPMLDTLPLNQDEDQFTLTVTTATTPALSYTAHITTRVLRHSAYLPLTLRDNAFIEE